MKPRATHGYRAETCSRDLRALLTNADPAAEAAELPADEVLQIRRAMVAAVEREQMAATPWRRALAIAALVLVMVAAGVAIGRKLPPAGERPLGHIGQTAEAGERRQVQFATPGGTRVIWTLDPEFELQRGTP